MNYRGSVCAAALIALSVGPLPYTDYVGSVLYDWVLAVLLYGQDCQQHAHKLAKPKLHLLLLYPQEQMFSSQTC